MIFFSISKNCGDKEAAVFFSKSHRVLRRVLTSKIKTLFAQNISKILHD